MYYVFFLLEYEMCGFVREMFRVRVEAAFGFGY